VAALRNRVCHRWEDSKRKWLYVAIKPKDATGGRAPDMDAQVGFINEKSLEFLRQNEPVISVDAKKKELVGNFKNNGKTYTYSRKEEPGQGFRPRFPIV